MTPANPTPPDPREIPRILSIAAGYWRMSILDCVECGGPAYDYLRASTRFTKYLRCPACRQNIFSPDHCRLFDHRADHLLDFCHARQLLPRKRSDRYQPQPN